MRSGPPGIHSHPRQSKVVDSEVNRESDQLMKEQMRQSNNRHILHIIPQFRVRGMSFLVGFFEIRNERYVFIEVIGVFVVC